MRHQVLSSLALTLVQNAPENATAKHSPGSRACSMEQVTKVIDDAKHGFSAWKKMADEANVAKCAGHVRLPWAIAGGP